MAAIEKKSFNLPDEVQRPAQKVKDEVIVAGGLTFHRVTTQPGWRWSIDLKPVMKTESCQKHHPIYMISGRLGARMNDGQEAEFGPGDLAVVPPGHDGWTIGNAPAVWLEIPH